MAKIVKAGKRFQVRHSTNNLLLASFTTKAAAQKKVRQLHKRSGIK